VDFAATEQSRNANTGQFFVKECHRLWSVTNNGKRPGVVEGTRQPKPMLLCCLRRDQCPMKSRQRLRSQTDCLPHTSGSDRKVLDIDSFKAAFVKALSDAYERGLEDGLATKTTGPDA
jgi:hypothetical protein